MQQSAVERNYYLVRSCRNIPLENGVIGIGWDDVKFCDFPNAEEIIKNITQVLKWNIGRHSNQIRRFKAIKEGDVVVVPYWGTAVIGVALGKELHDPKYYGQMGSNQQQVRFPRDASGKVKLIPRGSLREGLQKRLKIRITVADLREFKDDLDAALSKLEAGDAYSWSSGNEQKLEGLEQAFKKTLLEHIRTGKTGLKSGGTGLEHLVKELLDIDGFNDVSVFSKKAFKGSGDADVWASKTDVLRTDEFLIQVKHHDGKTGDWGLKQLLEIPKLMPEYADCQLVLVTSGDISEENSNFAEENDITILDGTDLVEWICRAIPRLSSKTKAVLGISGIPQILA